MNNYSQSFNYFWSMKRIIFCLFFFTTLALKSNAQVGANNPQVNDSLIKLLMKRHITINKIKQSIPGYRVQIYFGNNRNKATEVKNDFMRLYTDVPSYLLYQQPNFKIRVGDFKTRLEAMKLLKQIQPVFESAFIVKDDVKIPVLN